MDDYSKLKDTEHMLQWFADDPYSAIRGSLESMLIQQVADSQLQSLRVISLPQWLTGARPSEADSSETILVRSGVAFEFCLTVAAGGQLHHLTGVFTWVGVHLDQPGHHKHRTWIDLDGTLATFGSDEELMTRLYFE